MKKLLFLITFLFAFTISENTFAQNTTANLNISLSDVLSFNVTQPAELTVNFDSETKYTNGITALAIDHITVISTKGYTVKAISGTITGVSALTSSSIKISTAIGATNNGNTSGITYGNVVTLPDVGGTPIAVITATNSSFSGGNSTNKFNVTYLIGSAGTYAGKTVGSNVIPVVYTVTQP